MTPEELEQQLLSSIVDSDGLRLCHELGLSKSSFIIERLGEVFEYIEKHARENSGEMPTPDDFKILYEFIRKEPGDLKSYVAAVRDSEIGRDANKILVEEVSHLESDAGSAVKSIMKRLADLRIATGKRVSYLDRDAPERFIRFEEAADASARGEVYGLPTGLKTFDESGIGWQPGEFVVILGSQGVGKSWLLMKFCAEIYHVKKKVLLISPEMTNAEQALRFDTMLSGIEGGGLDASKIFKGEMDRETYQDWLMSLTGRSDFICIDSAEAGEMLTFEFIMEAVVEHQPDVVAVDGLHLLGSRDGKGAGWEVLKNGCALLKSVAQQNQVVIIAAHQPDKSASKREDIPPALHQTGYSMGVTQSSDIVISIARSKDFMGERRYAIRKLRNRPPITDIRFMRWDVNDGIIEDLEEPKDSF